MKIDGVTFAGQAITSLGLLIVLWALRTLGNSFGIAPADRGLPGRKRHGDRGPLGRRLHERPRDQRNPPACPEQLAGRDLFFHRRGGHGVPDLQSLLGGTKC